jgi:hypothetical protein
MIATAVRSGIRVTNGLGSALHRAGVSPVSLAEPSLLDAARRATRLEDFGDADNFLDPFRRLLVSLEAEASLTLLGRVAARRDLTGLLCTRLRLRRDRVRNPDIAGERIDRPVFIVGLPRTGSTLLHHLLGQDPQSRVPQAWEVMYPSPPPTRETYDTDPRIAQATRQLRWLDWLAPDFKAIHPVGAQLPLECIAIMSASFRATRFQTTYNVPSYEAWLEQEDMLPAYLFHRSVLQQLQWRAPGARWVLKAPSHLFTIEALLRTYPDARIVQTHRDPVTVVASLASMSATLQRAFTDRIQPRDIGREVLQRWTTGLEHSMHLRQSGRLPADRFVDVHYHELARDPLGTVRRIYAQLGMPLTENALGRMAQYLADNPQDKHGAHRYTLESFGLDGESLDRRFKGYREYFGVPSEPPSRQ